MAKKRNVAASHVYCWHCHIEMVNVPAVITAPSVHYYQSAANQGMWECPHCYCVMSVDMRVIRQSTMCKVVAVTR